MSLKKITQKFLPSALLAAASFLNPESLEGKVKAKKAAATAVKKPNLKDPDAFLRLANPTATKELPPQVRAFLDTIAFSEGTDGPNGYRMHYTKRLFGKNLDRHPNKIFCGGGWCSSAAGRYQILWKTEKTIPISGFDPRDQDREALYLIGRRGALNDVHAAQNKSRFLSALSKLNDEWASFPGSPHGQPTHSKERLWIYFRQRHQGYVQAKWLYNMAANGRRGKLSVESKMTVKPKSQTQKKHVKRGTRRR